MNDNNNNLIKRSRNMNWRWNRKGRKNRRENIIGKSDNLYCDENDCLNERIKELHLMAVKDSNNNNNRTTMMNDIDCYIAPCVFLRSIDSMGNILEKCEDSSSLFKLSCICGDPNHEVNVKKNFYDRQFRTLLINSKKSNNKGYENMKKNVKICLQEMVSFKSDVMCFLSLPDTGIFLRAVLQKRFFSGFLTKHNDKCIRDLDGLPPCKSNSTNNNNLISRRRENPAMFISEHACALIIQVIFLVYFIFYLKNNY
jgi:hypothetical protein